MCGSEREKKVEQQNNKQTKQTKLNFQTHGEEEEREKKKSFIFSFFFFIHVFQFISLICFVYLI